MCFVYNFYGNLEKMWEIVDDGGCIIGFVKS